MKDQRRTYSEHKNLFFSFFFLLFLNLFSTPLAAPRKAELQIAVWVRGHPAALWGTGLGVSELL